MKMLSMKMSSMKMPSMKFFTEKPAVKKLTVKTFLLLLVLSLSVILFAYGCIWILLPYADKKQAQNELAEKSEQLVSNLRVTEKHDSELLFTDFIRATGADILLLDREGNAVSLFTFEKVTTDIFQGNQYPFRFADSTEDYLLITRYNPARSDEIADAVRNSIPYVTVVIVLLSCLSAFLFSHYTTLPIIRISNIAGRIADLDFSWYCPDVREDEIGVLSQSINELSDKLHTALAEIHRRNAVLEDEITLEKERERRRMLFFSGVSHELKTPIAVVIGQLEGMQAGIGVYKDREKYLARSAEILQSLNSFVREILFVSHLDMETQAAGHPVNLSRMMDALIGEYGDYAELSAITITTDMEKDVWTYGDETLLKKALGNVIGNAVTHSPENGSVTVTLSRADGKAALTVVNAPAHIDEKHLPHLFEAFYRIDQSAEHGSGLGLYITRMILEMYRIPHSVENTGNGVRFCAIFTTLVSIP